MTASAANRIALMTLIASLLALPALAGESRIHGPTGEILTVDGYGRNATEYLESPPVEVIVNELVHACVDRTGADDCRSTELRTWAEGGPFLTYDESQNIRAFLGQAMAELESTPHARIRFAPIGGHEPILSARDAHDGLNVVTLVAGFESGFGASASGASHVGENAAGEPTISNFDIRIDADYVTRPTTGYALMLHELMHGVGVNHSWLTHEALTRLALEPPAPPSIMSYGNEGWNGLSADDATVVARMYPDLTNPMSNTTGTVRGVAVDGGEEIYGAAVYLVEVGTDIPVAHRITGFGHVAPADVPGGARSGEFDLDGVAPGTYDLLVASKRDPDVILSSRRGIDDAIVGPSIWQGENFDEAVRPRGWVRGIEVRVGEIVDLGEVRFGDDRAFTIPAGGIGDAQLRWSGAGYGWYWFDVWNAEDGELVRSGWTRNRSFATSLPAGRHAVRIWGWNGSASVSLQYWTWADFTPRPTSVTWDRPFRVVYGGIAGPGSPLFHQVEPVSDYLFVYSGGNYVELVSGHGDRYTRVLQPAFHYNGTGARVDVQVFGSGHYHDGVSEELSIVGP